MDQQKKTNKTCGVWTNTASSLVPRVEIEQSRAGYLKMVGCLIKLHDNDEGDDDDDDDDEDEDEDED